jgi:hypothetical protein
MRMLVTWRNERACSFNARMASLHGLLRAGQIPANENVDIRSAFSFRSYLRETGVGHFCSFRSWGETVRLGHLRVIDGDGIRQIGSRFSLSVRSGKFCAG